MDNSQQDRENYLHIEIRRSPKGNDFTARFRSYFGEMESGFMLSVSQIDVAQAMDRASQTAIKSFTRSGPDNVLDPMKGIGQRLFTALFKGRPEVFYRQSQERARGGLLVLLHMENDPELQAMPWEFLHDGQDYINLSTRSTLVRYPLRAIAAPPPEPVTPPLRILFVTASPKDLPQVSENELVSGLEHFPGFETRIVSGATEKTFAEALYQWNPHILHLVMYSEIDSAISRTSSRFFFESDTGQSHLIEFEKLMNRMSFREPLRLMCLHTGGTYLMASKLADFCPAVIGVQSNLITLNALTAFNNSLYQAISAGQTLATAVSRGRQAMALQNPGSLEWGLPVFYTTTPDAVLLARAQPGMSMSLPAAAESPVIIPEQQRELSKLQIKLGILQRNLETIEKQKAVSFGLPSPGLDEETQEMKKEIAAIKTRVHKIAPRPHD